MKGEGGEMGSRRGPCGSINGSPFNKSEGKRWAFEKLYLLGFFCFSKTNCICWDFLFSENKLLRVGCEDR